MTDENSRGLECPDRQAESTENNATCPNCETPIWGVVTRGPSDHFLEPCGCRVPTASVRALAGGPDRGRGVATDGGEDWTSGTVRVEQEDLVITDDGELVDITRVLYRRYTDKTGVCPFCQSEEGVEFVDRVGFGGTYRKQRFECECGAFGEGRWTWEAGVKGKTPSDSETEEEVTDDGQRKPIGVDSSSTQSGSATRRSEIDESSTDGRETGGQE